MTRSRRLFVRIWVPLVLAIIDAGSLEWILYEYHNLTALAPGFPIPVGSLDQIALFDEELPWARRTKNRKTAHSNASCENLRRPAEQSGGIRSAA
jgi:hypothetical protein